MATQLLFGEHFELLDSKGNWQLIRITYDGYECWIDKKQFLPVSEKNIRQITEKNTAVTTELVQLAIGEQGEIIPVVLGSSLPKFKDKKFYIEKEKYSFEGAVSFPFAKNKVLPNGDDLGGAAKWYLNTPYLWGGRSPFGIDCSGFTQMVFKLCGLSLKRDAWQQAQQGETLSFLEEAQPGDLAFFDNEDGKIVHVGIITPSQLSTKGKESSLRQLAEELERGGMQIIHSSGKVRIDKLDHHGIFNEEVKKYTHRLRVIKRHLSF